MVAILGSTMDVIKFFKDSRRMITVSAGEKLFSEGDRAKHMYVLIEGIADIYVGDTLVETATPGAFLGEMALVDSAPRSAAIVCRSQCRLVPIDVRQFDALVRDAPEFARQLMLLMSVRLRGMNERLKALQASSKVI